MVSSLPFIAALIAAFAMSLAWKPPQTPYGEQGKSWFPGGSLGTRKPHISLIIALLLLLSIGVRSYVGVAGVQGCSKLPEVAFAIAGVAFAGKALGGILADRFGWINLSVSALVMSAPFLAFAGGYTVAVVVGMLFFQMTMAVTLAALAVLLPTKPAFAFGCASLAFVLGALPTFFDVHQALYSPAVIIVLVLGSAAALYAALRLLRGGKSEKGDRQSAGGGLG